MKLILSTSPNLHGNIKDTEIVSELMEITFC